MIITAPRVITALPDAPVLEPGYVVTAGDRITAVGQDRPPGPPDLELDAGVLVPGLVDLQVNGYFGVDFGRRPGRLGHVSRAAAGDRRTSFVPTFITAPVRRLGARAAAAFGNLPARSSAAPGCSACTSRARSSRRDRHGAHNPDWIVTAGRPTR